MNNTSSDESYNHTNITSYKYNYNSNFTSDDYNYINNSSDHSDPYRYIPTVYYVVTCTIVCIGLPLTLVAIYALYSLVQKDHVTPIYVINLLISDLIQLCCMIIQVARPRGWILYKVFYYIYVFGLMSSVGFMVCVAMERYLVVAWPLWYRFRRTIKSSVVVQKDHVTPIYVINLLISDLIQLCCMIIQVARPMDWILNEVFYFLYFCALTSSVGFMVCVAMERYLVVAWPLWYRFRRTIKSSVVVCVVVWALYSSLFPHYPMQDFFFDHRHRLCNLPPPSPPIVHILPGWDPQELCLPAKSLLTKNDEFQLSKNHQLTPVIVYTPHPVSPALLRREWSIPKQLQAEPTTVLKKEWPLDLDGGFWGYVVQV
ncbi:hypothetical protein L3Q82_012102 [Scortum barcoo]|uniref:Uncharacterized protein n=1 Tax=Scortum barcoo TaxID=214431 RepID=A0ACB8W796_9TELE|nr:hypothetical protein L3Q82_012102 [Scortum barcoo]